MRSFIPSLVLALAGLLFAGCSSTPQDRISQNRAFYESLPSDVQRKVSAGQVDVGYSEEVVELALGKPSRRYSRSDASGQSEVWVYTKEQSRWSFGLGVGGGSYRSGVSTGVGVSTGDGGDEEYMRVVFQDRKVVAIEATRNR